MAFKVPPPTGGDFTPAPKGLHQAVLVDVVDWGYRLNKRFDKIQRKVETKYALDAVNEETGDQIFISDIVTLSFDKKANLRAKIESAIGRNLTKAEAEGGKFDLESLIGQNFQVLVVHNEKDGDVRDSIKTVMPAATGTEPLEIPEDYERSPLNYTQRPNWPIVDPNTGDELTDEQIEILTSMDPDRVREDLDGAIASITGFEAEPEPQAEEAEGDEDIPPHTDEDVPTAAGARAQAAEDVV